jgi:hypothetical protein
LSGPGQTWKALLSNSAGAFTSPSFALFVDLLCAWVCATGRRTITGMVAVMDPATRGAHDAYHRLVRAGRWSLEAVWAAMVYMVIGFLDPTAPIICVIDDTLLHRPGPKVEGAGNYRDGVRSTPSRIVYARGLCLVILALRVTPPWGGMPIAIPVGVRLHRKNGPKLTDLARALMAELAHKLPDRNFILVADGAYATLAGDGLERTTVISRMRRDAALYGPCPPPTGKRGRPRTRGERLPTPEKMSSRPRTWTTVSAPWRGGTITRLIWTRQVLWYNVNPHAMVLLVIVRDPHGVDPDDYFFSTDLATSPPDLLTCYGDRWAIEVTHRDVKQLAHTQEPQTWKGEGPERAANLGFWLHAATWIWYLRVSGTTPVFTTQPWYKTKRLPSFADALAALRRELWQERISATSPNRQHLQQITTLLVDALAMAA